MGTDETQIQFDQDNHALCLGALVVKDLLWAVLTTDGHGFKFSKPVRAGIVVETHRKKFQSSVGATSWWPPKISHRDTETPSLATDKHR
jgi:hypothetical protein